MMLIDIAQAANKRKTEKRANLHGKTEKSQSEEKKLNRANLNEKLPTRPRVEVTRLLPLWLSTLGGGEPGGTRELCA